MDWIKWIFTNTWFYYLAGGIILTGVLLALLLNFVIMPEYTNYKEGVTVPDVTKISLTEAQQKLETYGLRHEVLDRRANASYPANYILEQEPAALQIVKPNRKVYLTVNTEVRPTAVVPDVEDLSLRNARIQIENYGFEVGTISYESSRFRNAVMEQSLAPGDTADKGSVINLVVSDGLGDRMVAVPDVVGLRLTEAQQQLREASLRIEEIRFEPSAEEPNTVLSIRPDAEELTEGQALTLVVAERLDAREESEAGAVGADTTLSAPPDTTNQDNDQ
ncbi:MAG: PASTA domain-containing protein [Bacteroidetes bacterium]|jgi:beta-lactam-binding protein with PASTA domain|nr:PASTA domain-containing protein [Bacteroidota bacterium]